MSLSDFLAPIPLDNFTPENGFLFTQIGNNLIVYDKTFPDLQQNPVDIALIGICDDRGTPTNQGCADAANAVRHYLYKLQKGDYAMRIADLGNVLSGERVQDTYAALKIITAELIKQHIIPVIIGGGQDLTYAQYCAYEELDQKVDLAVIDSHLSIQEDLIDEVNISSNSFMSAILLHEPNYLFNYSNIGYQVYYAGQESLRVMDKLYFDAHRLGSFANGKINEVEPIVRNADLLSFDISAIRSSDAIGNKNATPNGFYGEQACQICRYAGMSDKLSSIGFYEYNPKLDPQGQTAILLAQMIWYFFDGFYNRKKDFPLQPKSAYITYRASIDNHIHELIFVKSKKSDRWWMQVPYPTNTKSVNERFHMVPCRYEDYQLASTGEMPDLWWRTYQKLI